MKKIFTFCVAVLASVSMWAAYAPKADEVIILNDVYDASATEAGYSKHAAIAWGGTADFSDRKAGDPNNNGEATSSNVKTCSVKGNGKGKNITVSFEGCSQIIVYHEKQSSRYVELRAGSKTGDLLGKSTGDTYFTTVDLNANNSYSIFLHGVKDDGGDQDFYIYAVKLIKGETCTDPEFTVSPTEGTGFVGDPIDITISSKNQSKPINPVVTVDGVPGVSGTDYSFSVSLGVVQATPLKAGTFVITFSQASNGTYCAAEESATFVISEKTPVAACAIEGPAKAYIGKAVTFTATAANASDYAWTVNGVDANTNAAEFTFTPAAAGEYSIVCSARNKFNAAEEWIASEPIALNVTKLCGDLITATLNGGSSATMGGVVGGTFDTNLGNGKYKVDKGVYIGVKLASGTFMAGDVVTITMSTAGQNYPCLFGDKDRTNLLYLAEEVSEATEYQIILPAAATGLTSIYLSRDADDATYKWNPTVSTISVSRSCEASSNAEIAGLTINGEAVEAENGVYSYEVSATENLSQVAVVYTLVHPLASATPASGFTIDVPAAGADANSQVITVTAENGTEVAYTVLVAKAAALSDNADLRELTVAGYALAPEFDAAVLNYTIEKAYAAQMPTLDDVTALTDHNAAKATIALNDNVFTITVTAEDKSTKVYTITVNTAAAKKDLLRPLFSNGAYGYVLNGNITVPYLASEDEPTFVSTTFWNADGAPSAAVKEGKLVVTGVDADEVVYPIIYEAVPVANIQLETAITFDSTENYIYSVYGWDDSKGWKIAKDVEEAANHRISEGKDRLYMALPAADSLYLTSGSGKDRPVRITVNGVASDVTKLAKQNGEVAIVLNASANNFVCIESNGSNGDGGIIAIRLHKNSDTPSALDNTEAVVKAVKVVREGKLFIEKNGVLYNAQGNVVK